MENITFYPFDSCLIGARGFFNVFEVFFTDIRIQLASFLLAEYVI